MDFVQVYGNIIKKKINKGKINSARRALLLGLKLERLRVNKIAKNIPGAYKYLSTLSLNSIMDGIKNPDNCAWTNIFSPVEILQNFELNCVSIEAVSSIMSGFKNADVYIDKAETLGIAGTLCSYHKNFIGAVKTGLVRPPKFAVTTSMICDGNINTFHHLAKDYDIPHYIIDVPDQETPANVKYVTDQLKELISLLENATGRKFDYDKLKETLDRENKSLELFREYIKYQKDHFYPNSLTLHMYTIIASHLQIGTKEIYDYYKQLLDEIKTCPKINGKKLFWVHLIPYYQETLKEYFNFKDDYYIQAFDMNFDYRVVLDIENPLEALAKKMINNIYNGSYEKKAENVLDLVKELESDGVIHFCHWGCKQSSGGMGLLKEKLSIAGIPLLSIDGDGIDRRNSHDGQIKTRLEAFLEILDGGNK